MIISHRYRYIFIEVPLTGSWAIRQELCNYYGGEPILHKHATYEEFLHKATTHEKNYFSFATVRNPLDAAVSQFFKLKTNYKGVFTDSLAIAELLVDQVDLKKFRFIQATNASFEDYFRRYHRRPYQTMMDRSVKRLSYVIRYERLQEGFSEVLQILGLEQVQPVPVVNKTPGRCPDWQSYYTPGIIEQAKHKFGPCMRRLGYQFPVEWGPAKPHLADEIVYWILSWPRHLYLTYFRYNSGVLGRVARSLVAATR
jgi:hypothetical protein